ncbi:MAG: metallophosphoesterase [Clostridium sp.]|nr:metallophosphoesterase [Clostridium sp.]
MIYGILFLYIALSTLVGIRIYISLNKLLKINKLLYSFIFFIFSSSFFIFEILSTKLPHKVDKILAFIGSYYISFFAYAVILFIISFILTVLFQPQKIDLYLVSTLLSIIIVAVGVFLANSTHIKTYDITTEKPLNNNSLKVALVSDVHLSYTIGPSRLQVLKNDLNNLDADVIIFAGDLLDGAVNPVIKENMIAYLKDLKSTYGTYFALGNHEYYSGCADGICKMLSDYGIKVLTDKTELINNEFYIIGRNDIKASDFRDARKPLSELCNDIDKNKFSIVIDHNPKYVEESQKNSIDLQVSGHTHKGQIFPGNILTKLMYPLDYGYKKFGNTNLVVSSGFGTWGTAIRTTGRSEIVLINIHN